MRNIVNNGTTPVPPSQGKDFSQDGLLEIFFRRRWIIVTSVMLFIVAAFVYLFVATPIFTSTARIYVEQTGPRIISDYEGVMTRSNNYLYTQRELIQSTPIIGKVAESLRDRDLKTFEDVDNISGYIKKHADVVVGRKDDIISVSFDSPYPEEAALIVNDVIDEYITYHTASKRTTVSEVLKILQKEKVKRDQELSDKFKAILAFTEENGVISFEDQSGHIGFQRLAKLSEALTEAEIRTMNAKADYDAVQSMISDPLKVKQYILANSDFEHISLFSVEENNFREELKDLNEAYKTVKIQCSQFHPATQNLKQKITEAEQKLNDHIQQFAQTYLSIVERKWETARHREIELYSAFCEQKNDVQKLGVKATEYAVLKSELERTERLCEILDNRIKELNVTEDTGALNISILEVAHAEDKPTKPEKAKAAAMATLMGLFTGCFFALIRDWLDIRLKSVDEISAVLGVPVLGFVPTLSDSQNVLLHGHKMLGKFMTSVTNKLRPLTHAKAHGISTQVSSVSKRGQKVYLEPMSVEAEAYRTIRTAVFFGAYKEKAKKIVVTSPQPRDGKSTLISNLGIAMAQAGQKTIIIDADFRKPSQNVIFGLGNDKGISSVLAGKDTLEAATQRTPVEGLDILACGLEDSNPSGMFNSDGFKDILETLAARYDRILIDSPPVTYFTDSQILAAVCDLTLLVLRADKSTRRASQQAVESLVSVGARILGAVVNDVSAKHTKYGYSQYSQRNYATYGYGGKSSKSSRKEPRTDTLADEFLYEDVTSREEVTSH